MRRMSHYPLLLCLGCLGATFLAAQAAKHEPAAAEVEITSEPHHHLAFTNEYLRVFAVHVDPSTETQMHWHRHDYIAVNLGTADLSNLVKDRPPISVTIPDGEVRFSSANFAHTVRNVGPTPFRNLTIEILQDDSLRNSATQGKIHWDEDRGLEVLDRGTKQILFVKDGIRVTEFELQPGAVVPMPHLGPHLLVAVTDLDLRSYSPSEKQSAGNLIEREKTNSPSRSENSMPAHLNAGGVKWLPANSSHSIANPGSAVAKFVTLEFPSQ